MKKEQTFAVSIEVRHNNLIYGYGATDIRPTRSDFENLKREMNEIGKIPENDCTNLITIDIQSEKKNVVSFSDCSTPKTSQFNAASMHIFINNHDGCLCAAKMCPQNIINGECQNEFIKRTLYKHLFENKLQK